MKLSNINAIFMEEGIEFYGGIPFSACECRRPDMIERQGIDPSDIRTVIPFLIPYYVDGKKGNISLYARALDYHYYAEGLFSRILSRLEAEYGGRFLGFADKSPIQENVAASMAGLGAVGDNFMLINEKYGSFVFMAELLSTLPPEVLGFSGEAGAVTYCTHCGACRGDCPMEKEGIDCLSAVTQKKGELSEAEAAAVVKYGTAWGCDLCQLACPMTRAALAKGATTPIAFFRENRIAELTAELLDGMDDETFLHRAFSWRGRAPLARNLALLKK